MQLGRGAGVRASEGGLKASQGHSAKRRVKIGAGLMIRFPKGLCFRNEQEGKPHRFKKKKKECVPQMEKQVDERRARR